MTLRAQGGLPLVRAEPRGGAARPRDDRRRDLAHRCRRPHAGRPLGWLMARHGLAADNVLGVELVTAGGRVVEATADSDLDLFWALRGGAESFGIAASIKFRLHPMPTVTGGLIAHPVERAGEMLRFYRETSPSVSDDLTVFAGLVHAPDGVGR